MCGFLLGWGHKSKWRIHGDHMLSIGRQGRRRRIELFEKIAGKRLLCMATCKYFFNPKCIIIRSILSVY